MRLEINENQGYIILDDNTGEILSITVKNVIDNKVDILGIKSYSRRGDKHYKMEFKK